jgi:hypothetical protein
MSHWIYHPYHQAVVVESKEYERYLSDGWYDSPAKFPTMLQVDEEKISLDSTVIKRRGRPKKEENVLEATKVEETHLI